MKKLMTLSMAAVIALGATAATVTDELNSNTIALTTSYSEQEVKLKSDAVYLVTMKDEGSGPQFKAGGSGIVTTVSGGKAAAVEVTWGAKSNENVLVYGSTEPYTASNTEITGTLLGEVAFNANGTSSLEISGEWPYIGITSSAIKGKACQVVSVAVTWITEGEAPAADPCEGLVINEVCGDDGTSEGQEDWVEIVNSTDHSIDLEGLQVVKLDEDNVSETLYTYPAGATIEAGAYMVCSKGIEFTAGLSNTKNITIKLISKDGSTIDMFSKMNELTPNGNHYPGGSYALIPDINGKWASVGHATPGAVNDPTPVEPRLRSYAKIADLTELTDGTEIILINEEHSYAMANAWGNTKSNTVYQLAEPVEIAKGETTVDINKVAVCYIVTNTDGDGTVAIRFGETNNYLNDSRYLSCKEFKNFDYKKNDDAAKGTRAKLSLNAGGDVEIDYGTEAGTVKFNYKDDGTSRFLNYDPTDKPEDHKAVCIYKYTSSTGITDITAAAEGKVAYYNLQGMKVERPTTGVYIRTTGNKAEKIIIR